MALQLDIVVDSERGGGAVVGVGGDGTQPGESCHLAAGIDAQSVESVVRQDRAGQVGVPPAR